MRDEILSSKRLNPNRTSLARPDNRLFPMFDLEFSGLEFRISRDGGRRPRVV